MGRKAPNPALTRFLVTMVGAPLLRKLNRTVSDVRGAQEAVLRKILLSARNTAFGKDHSLGAIRTIDEYRRAVPIRNFEGHRPYIERMCRGESDVLFAGKPIMYNTTSGTTDKPKFIPVSKDYFQETYKGVSRLWLYTCMRDNPTIYNGHSLSAVAPAQEGTVEDGTPYGAISGAVYQSIPGILQKTYSSSYPIVCIRDYLKKYYAMMRCALELNITFIVCPSPSNLLRFHQTAMDEFGSLVKDIRDGSLRKDVAGEIDPRGREETLSMFSPNPARARMLERLMNEHGENLRPKHYWPDCACVNLWKQGNFALMLPKLEDYFADKTTLRAFGYQASEGRPGLVLGNDWAHSLLAAHVYHFEFIEESARENDNPPTLLAHELEVGRRYYLLLTNGSGLYRYDINDIIEIVGFHGEFPLFRFIQKGEGITSLTGEKLSEQQVIQAVQDAASGVGTGLEFYRMLCDLKNERYVFMAEFAAQTPAESKTRLVAKLDELLQQINCEYQVKRGSQRLGIPTLCELGPLSAQRFKEELLRRRATTDGQYKETFLTKNPVHEEVLMGLAKNAG